MGNQLIKDTHVEKDPIGNGGVEAQWQMRNGHRLDKGKIPVTIFWFDKKKIAKASSKSKTDFLTILKKEAQMLARFKHPNILSLVTPLLDDPKSLGFVTEQVSNSLHSLIAENKVSDLFSTELETKFRILEIAETLNFLHNSARTCHLSISPENIYLMPDGKWKLGGLTFATQIIQGNVTESSINFIQQGELTATPSLKFSAPEVVDTPSKGSYSSDIFSFGCIIYMIFKINHDKSTNNPYLFNTETVSEHKNAVSRVNRMDFSCLPEGLRQMVIRMVNPDSSMRITATDILNHSWFKDPLIQTVKVLEKLYEKAVPHQQAFLKGLAQNISNFEPKFVKTKLVPLLVNLFTNPQLIPSILSIFLKIMEAKNPSYMTNTEFNTLLWPSIKTMATGKEMPAQALYLLVQNTGLLLEHIDVKEFQTVFIPLLTKAFDCGVQKLQVLAIKKAEMLFNKIDYNILKSQLLPRILNLCTDSNIEVRKQALILLSKIYTLFDKNIINDQVLTALERLRKLKNNYKINMTMLAIFEGIAKNIGMDMIANKILVSLIPMLADQTLSKSEHKAYASTIHTYLRRIEEEQQKFYEGRPEENFVDLDDEEKEDKPMKEEKQTSNFEFLNMFEDIKNMKSQPSSMNDIDFAGFEQLGNGNIYSSNTPKSNDNFNFGSNHTNNMKSTPLKVEPQFKPRPQNSIQNFTEEKIQNENINPNTMENKRIESSNIKKPFGQNSVQQQSYQPSSVEGWDNLDQEMNNLGFSTTDFNPSSNNELSNNQFQFNSGNMGYNSSNNNTLQSQNGWGNQYNNANRGSTGFGLNSTVQNNNGTFGSQINNQVNINQGNQPHIGQNNNGFQVQSNQSNKFGMQIGGLSSSTNQTTYKSQINGTKGNTNKLNTADDFFDTFDLGGSTKPKNNNLNFIKKPTSSGDGDLL